MVPGGTSEAFRLVRQAFDGSSVSFDVKSSLLTVRHCETAGTAELQLPRKYCPTRLSGICMTETSVALLAAEREALSILQLFLLKCWTAHSIHALTEHSQSTCRSLADHIYMYVHISFFSLPCFPAGPSSKLKRRPSTTADEIDPRKGQCHSGALFEDAEPLLSCCCRQSDQGFEGVSSKSSRRFASNGKTHARPRAIGLQVELCRVQCRVSCRGQCRVVMQ